MSISPRRHTVACEEAASPVSSPSMSTTSSLVSPISEPSMSATPMANRRLSENFSLGASREDIKHAVIVRNHTRMPVRVKIVYLCSGQMSSVEVIGIPLRTHVAKIFTSQIICIQTVQGWHRCCEMGPFAGTIIRVHVENESGDPLLELQHALSIESSAAAATSVPMRIRGRRQALFPVDDADLIQAHVSKGTSHVLRILDCDSGVASRHVRSRTIGKYSAPFIQPRCSDEQQNTETVPEFDAWDVNERRRSSSCSNHSANGTLITSQ